MEAGLRGRLGRITALFVSGYHDGAMERDSVSKLNLKLLRRSSVKSEEIVKVKTEGETANKVSRGGNIDSQNGTFCELHPAEIDNVKTASVEDEWTGGSNSPASMKQATENEIADIFLPDGHEVAVVVSWNWDSSQRNLSPKPEKVKSTTPVGQKKRSSKICSPLMRGQLPARRKRLLKKEQPNSKSSLVSELQALSEKLQKAKECVQISEGADDGENELCFEIPNSATECLHDFNQEHPPFKLDNLEKIKNDSFRKLLEDVDDDCLIQCSQEVEKTLQEYVSPLKNSPKLQNLGVGKLNKNSPGRAKTPSKGKVQSSILPRRSPRIRNQHPLTKYSGKPRSITSTLKKDDVGKVLDEDLVESLLDDEIELLSQIPSPSAILRSDKQKQSVLNDRMRGNMAVLSRNKTRQMLPTQPIQGNLNGIVNIVAGSSRTAPLQQRPLPIVDNMQFSERTQHIVLGCIPAVGTTKQAAAFTAKEYSMNKNYNTSNSSSSVARAPEKAFSNSTSTEDKPKPFDDSFGEPALCNLLDSVESTVLSCSPLESSSPVSTGQQIPSSPPMRCTPEEIEKKKQEALERRRNHSHQGSSVIFRDTPSIQLRIVQEDRAKEQQQAPGSPPRRYTPEEIEKKRLEAQKIKRQQSLFRTTACPVVPRQRLHRN